MQVFVVTRYEGETQFEGWKAVVVGVYATKDEAEKAEKEDSKKFKEKFSSLAYSSWWDIEEFTLGQTNH